jgi:hypothetical protein
MAGIVHQCIATALTFGRPPSRTLAQRLGIDLALVAIAIIGFWQRLGDDHVALAERIGWRAGRDDDVVVVRR